MEIHISINTDGDAFTSDPKGELFRALHKLAGDVGERGIEDAPKVIRDINGNTVGSWKWAYGNEAFDTVIWND